MFKVDNYVIDRVLRAYLLNDNDEVLGYLDQLTDVTIDMNAETRDITDARGVLIKRFYQSKSADLSATNALFNFNVAGLALGSTATTADPDAVPAITFNMRKSFVLEAGKTETIKNLVAGSLKVYGLTTSGSVTKEYEADTTADATHYSITSAGVLTPPTNDDETQYFVYYTKTITSGMQFINKADEFPRSVKIVIEVVGYDVCHTTADEPLLMVIEGDNFQISPETSIQIGGDDQSINFSGSFASSYCSPNKELFSISIEEDEED